jgi:hypothetical protein
MTPRTTRPSHVDIVRSESQAIAARSSGRSRATAENTTRPTAAVSPTAGKYATARSAAKSTASATTSWLRLNRQPRRIPTPKMTQE